MKSRQSSRKINGSKALRHSAKVASRQERRDIVVIGASAGGLEALQILFAGFPANLPASVFVVLHLSSNSPSLLAPILTRGCKMPIHEAEDGEPIRKGHIYIAPPDCHLLLEQKRLRVRYGPKENRHRPAVDPLFRSAALHYGPRAVGVILTGNLNDGTVGLWSIKEHGGVAIVQNPEEAMFPGMPSSAVSQVPVDHLVSLDEIPGLLSKLVRERVLRVPRPRRIPVNTFNELPTMKPSADTTKQNGAPSMFTCPDCNGTLWELEENNFLRFSCRTGHAFTAESLAAGLGDETERALWSAYRALSEKAHLLRRLQTRAQEFHQSYTAEQFEVKAKEAERDCETLRKVLSSHNVSSTSC